VDLQVRRRGVDAQRVAQSKTLPRVKGASVVPAGFGLRRPSAAFNVAEKTVPFLIFIKKLSNYFP
jgi:hypothetical protein